MTSILAELRRIDDPAKRRGYFAEEIRRMDEISVTEENRREAWEEGKIETRESMVRTVLEKLHDMTKVADLLDLDLKEVRRIATKFGLLH